MSPYLWLYFCPEFYNHHLQLDKMATHAYTNIIPISDYVALINEVAYWKKQYHDLQTELIISKSAVNACLPVKDQGVVRNLPIQEIVMLEADGNYTIFHLADGHKIISSRTLKVWIDTIHSLSNHFKRVHRSFFINTNHVIAHQSSQRVIQLTGNVEVHIARRNKFNLTTKDAPAKIKLNQSYFNH